MNKELPTGGQLERNLSQKIQKLYRQELEHNPGKITCQLFGNKLAVVIEDALTAVEKTLVNLLEETKTAEQLNSVINDTIKTKLRTLIEDTLTVKVDDIIFDSTLTTNRTGAIATLDRSPQVRDPESIPKNKYSKAS